MNRYLSVFTLFLTLLIQSCATSSPSDKNSSSYAVDPKELFSYSGFHQVMVSTGSKTIYIAGQVALDSEMNLVGVGDYQAQTIRALQNLSIAAEAAGATAENVVTSTMYIKNLEPGVAKKVMQGMAVALDGKPFPAHAFNLIGVETLADPGVLIEISAIAVVD